VTHFPGTLARADWGGRRHSQPHRRDGEGQRPADHRGVRGSDRGRRRTTGL